MTHDQLKLSEVTNVIVQAGGRGSRLGSFTRNKPKCLLSVDGKPLIYSLFDTFPKAVFIVIVDHLAEVFERYVATFPPAVSVRTIRARGHGTLGGLSIALDCLPCDASPFILLWSDIKLETLPDSILGPALSVGLTSAFPCRWTWSQETGFVEKASEKNGVMGIFASSSRTVLAGCPTNGDFVTWLSSSQIPLEPVIFSDAMEIGTIEDLEAHRASAAPARFFNRVEIDGDVVRKKARDPRFDSLIRCEAQWYKSVATLDFLNVPRLIAEQPLTLARVRGSHPYDLDVSRANKERTLERIVEALKFLHSRGTRPGCAKLTNAMYLEKPLKRLDNVQALAPHITGCDALRVNGLSCRNILHPFHARWFQDCVNQIEVKDLTPVHGDPTFSNILIALDGKPWFIDPRGHFGEPSLFGDPRYDWAKLYYSVVGSYDRFNARRFQVRFDGDAVDVNIEDHGWGHLRTWIEAQMKTDLEAIKIVHATIWLSLSGIVEDDYDSILGAYVMGLYHLELATA